MSTKLALTVCNIVETNSKVKENYLYATTAHTVYEVLIPSYYWVVNIHGNIRWFCFAFMHSPSTCGKRIHSARTKTSAQSSSCVHSGLRFTNGCEEFAIMLCKLLSIYNCGYVWGFIGEISRDADSFRRKQQCPVQYACSITWTLGTCNVYNTPVHLSW